MRALVKAERAPGLTMQQVPVPEIGPNDVLIRIRTSAICGTDMHIWKWDAWAQKTIPVPMHVGHEYVGVIERVGSAVTGYQVGDRVSGEGHIVCGYCRNCRAGKRHLCPNTVGVGVNRPGSFAEYLALPAVNVFKVPAEVPDEVAAIFDPFGNAVHTALSYDLVGEDVLITGAGPIGCMAVAICRFVGARHVVITDVNPWRLELARKMGATRAVDSAREDLRQVMKDLGMSEGFDVGLEMSGNGGAFRGMLDAMANGGRIALLGIFPGEVAIDWGQVVFKGLDVKGIYGRQMFETWYKMAAMVRSGLDVRPVITHRFPIADYRQGFEAMAGGQSGKVLLGWE
ncbi:MAG: L-threonine 3-dehydrogenase [Planctomycetes bacterium]|nr:L-threonine 3-dehydrogenase [Planctomycetota bacterium]